MKRFMSALVVLVMLFPAVSFAKGKKYKVVDVKNGGTIKGTIKASKLVNDQEMRIRTKSEEEKKYCGKSFKMGKYIISPNLEVKNVIVVVKNVEKGKAVPKTDLVLDNNKCQFNPLVGIAFKGQKYVIKNSDPFLHNTSLGLVLKDKRRTVYNLALPRQGQVINKPVRATGLHNIKCDAHPWMRAYLYASKHPYVAITDDKGNFEIKDLLPGKYEIMIWHEGFGEVTKKVEVKSAATAVLNHTFSK